MVEQRMPNRMVWVGDRWLPQYDADASPGLGLQQRVEHLTRADRDNVCACDECQKAARAAFES